MNFYDPEGNIVQRRPAESATPVAMAASVIIADIVGVDNASTMAAIAIVVAFVPAAITWLVTTVKS